MTTPTSYPYKRPGVFISETLTPLPQQVSPPGMAVACFVGQHDAGPSAPIKVTSWEQFMALYGGFGTGLNYLPFSVYSYFANGGRTAWVLRATPSDSSAASLVVKNTPLPPATTIVPTPDGTAPTGTGVAPDSQVTGVQFVARDDGANPEQTAFEIEWTAITPAEEVDAYLVELSNPNEGSFGLSLWVDQPADGSKPRAAFTELAPGVTYSVQITPYQGTAAGPEMDMPATFTTATGYTPVDALQITARGRGAYGNRIYVSTAPSWTSGRFHLYVKYGGTGQGQLVETWQDLSLSPSDPRYAVSLINSATAGSNYIQITNLLPPTGAPGTSPTPDASWQPEYVTNAPLATGTDGVQDVNLAQQLATHFDSVADVLLINLCGSTSEPDHVPPATQINAAIAWAEARRNAFLVIDAPRQPAPVTATTASTKFVETAGSYAPASSFAALYGPWVQVADPAGASVSSTRMLPPAGSVMGQFAQADAAIGPNRSPAGVAYRLVGAVGVEHQFTNDELDALNEAGVNVVRAVPQAGYCVMGARTLKKGMPDRYISIRRMLIFIENLLENVTRFAIFEPNGPDLWATLSALVNQQLLTLTQAGQLQSSVPDQAFFVVCDESNNTPQTVALGEIHITVGVALSSPAEFIVIEISQYQGGVSTATDTADTATTA